ncbi:hypothetical protein ABK040_014367 [Willaertia magna]
MDLSIAERKAYEFLVRSEEAKRWIEDMIQEKFPPGNSVANFGEMLRDGTALAKTAKIFAPSAVKKINKPQSGSVLEFMAVDNITQFINACKQSNFNEIYLFEVIDLWEGKNIYKVVHCLHTLSLHLYRHGLSIKIQHLKDLNFSREDIEKTQKMLESLEGAELDFPMIEEEDVEEEENLSSEQSDEKLKENILNEISKLADPELCEIKGEHLTEGISGKQNTFKLILKDSDGNVLKEGNDHFEVILTKIGEEQVIIKPTIENNNDGTFTVTYTPEQMGEYEMQISLVDGEFEDVVGFIKPNDEETKWKVKIDSNPFCDPTKCKLIINKKNEIYRVNQKINDYSIQTFDSFGNKGIGGEIFIVKIITNENQKNEKTFEGNVVDLKNGEYSIDFETTYSSIYKLQVFLKREEELIPIPQCLVENICIRDEGRTNPEKCLFIGLKSNLQQQQDELTTVVSQNNNDTIVLERKAGEVNRFIIQARDQFGNIRDIDYHPLVEEEFNVLVTLSGNSPRDINQFASPRSELIVTTPRGNDIIGTAPSTSSSSFSDGVVEATVKRLTSSEANGYSEIMKQYSDEHFHCSALYLVEFVLLQSGSYVLQTRLASVEKVEDQPKRNISMVGDAVTINLQDLDVTDATKSYVCKASKKARNSLSIPKIETDPTAIENTISSFKAGEAIKLTIQACDKYGNNRTSGGGQFTVEFRETNKNVENESNNNIEQELIVKAEDLQNGTHEVSFQLSKVHEYIIEIYNENRELIKHFPRTVSVVDSGVTEPSKTLLSGTGLTTCVQGKESFFTMRMKDQFGNYRTSGGDNIEIVLVNDARKMELPIKEITDYNDGSYSVAYTPKASGKHRLVVKINGQVVDNPALNSGLFVSPPNIEDASNVETILDHDLLSALMNAFRLEKETDNLVEQIQQLRNELVKQLRENTKIAVDVREKERKIALLAENRYRAEELLNQKGGIMGLFQKRKTIVLKEGLSLSSAESMIKENITLYGNLFYLLQTNPKYLAKCLFLVPQNQVDQFLQTVTLTLFGYAFNPREEYLILNLFNEALQLEVQSSTLESFLSGNPLLIKLLITYCHERISGRQFLQKVLYDKILEPILHETNLILDINPIAYLKEKIAKTEVETGVKSDINVNELTFEKAMEIDKETNEVIKQRQEKLLQLCKTILECFYNNINELPYGLRYVCRQLKNLLQKKNPLATEEEIQRVISYILFFRYLNPIMVAPDAFNLVDPTKKKISNNMRSNLGIISKVLMRISNFKGFDKSVDGHLTMLNDWIATNFDDFRGRFIKPALNIVEPEEYLGVHQYIELTQKKSPTITITINEIAQTHTLILRFISKIAPEDKDPLREVIDKFKGKVPEAETGKSEEITLPLIQLHGDSNGHLSSDDIKPEQLYEITKENFRALLRLITPQQLGESVEDTIDRADQYAESLLKENNMKSEAEGLALKKKIEEIRYALPRLEESLIITKDDHYRKILIDITKEIQNREELQKKQQREIERLRESLQSLRSHNSFLRDKDKTLDEFVQQTLKNYFKKQKASSSTNQGTGETKTFKFSYKELSEKYKVINDIVGQEISSLQKRALKFNISMNDSNPGVFTVEARLASLPVKSVVVRLDELLDKREKGQDVLKVDGVVLNVNMTIYLLNKKFLTK